MKTVLSKIFGKVGGGIAEKISNIIDKHTYSKEEKAILEKQITEVFVEAEADIQKNVSERWRYDLSSDSWLSKNVRPLTLIFLVVSATVLIFIDAGFIKFEVKDKWVDLLQLTLITVISAYFGGRSFEKIKKK
jgi:hypothetical protein